MDLCSFACYVRSHFFSNLNDAVCHSHTICAQSKCTKTRIYAETGYIHNISLITYIGVFTCIVSRYVADLNNMWVEKKWNDLPLPEVALSTKSCLTNSICTTAIFIEFPILASAYMLDTWWCLKWEKINKQYAIRTYSNEM